MGTAKGELQDVCECKLCLKTEFVTRLVLLAKSMPRHIFLTPNHFRVQAHYSLQKQNRLHVCNRFCLSVGYEKDVFAILVYRVEITLIQHHKYIYEIGCKTSLLNIQKLRFQKRNKHYKDICFNFDNNLYKMKNFIVIHFNFSRSLVSNHQQFYFLLQII